MLEGDGDSICGVNRLLGVKSLLFQMGWFMSVHVNGFIHLLAKSVIWRIQVPLSLKIKGVSKLWDDFAYRASFGR